MKKAEKIKWVLKNWGRAEGRARALQNKYDNMEFGLPTKLAVGGRDSGGGPSQQERYIVDKETVKNDASALKNNVKTIEKIVDSLPEKQRKVIIFRFKEELTEPEIAKRLNPTVSERTIERKINRAIDNLIERCLTTVYQPLRNLLE